MFLTCAEVKHFFESHRKRDLLQLCTSNESQLSLAHLVDIFESLNRINLLLQGKNINRINDYDVIRAFTAKLELCCRRVFKGEAASSPNLDVALKKSEVDLEGQLKSEVEFHLQLLKQEFEDYFADLDDFQL